MPFIYLQESEQFINLSGIAYVNVHPKFCAVHFAAASDGVEMYLEVTGPDADYLRKCLAEQVYDFGVKGYEDHEDVLEEIPF